MLVVIMLSVALFYCHGECRYAECRYAECRYAEYRYAECRYPECRGAAEAQWQNRRLLILRSGVRIPQRTKWQKD
jgi:hypothetical protein